MSKYQHITRTQPRDNHMDTTPLLPLVECRASPNPDPKNEWMSCRLCRAQLAPSVFKNFFGSCGIYLRDWWRVDSAWLAYAWGVVVGKCRLRAESGEEDDMEKGLE